MLKGSGLLLIALITGSMLSSSFENTHQQSNYRARVSWAGKGSRRVLVRVEPVNIDGREVDESIASLDVDLATWARDVKGARVDLNSLQVVKYSPETGNPEPYTANLYQMSPFDRPFRFYDQSPQYDFSAYEGYISEDTKANRPLKRINMVFGQRFFNPSPVGLKGKLVWTHTQVKQSPSHYAIYFDLLAPGKDEQIPPAGFIGDGGNRIVKEGNVSAPIGNVRGTAVDWNEDGLADILYGAAGGNLVLLRNTGTATNPEFKIRKVIYDVDGVPVDVGFDANPHVTDWNGDGKKDVLVGAERACIIYFQNVGTNAEPLLKFGGFVTSDNNMLQTPNWPIAELEGQKPGTVYKADYVATPYVVDWDNDGDPDLLAGGFVTGQIFLFENVGKNEDGTPKLTARGALEADGKPIDTVWAANPVAVDIDNDGDLDLLSGGKPQTPKGGDMADPDRLLYYYENKGSRVKPVLTQKSFPKNGRVPTGVTVMASLADFNNDKLLDLCLVVHSTRETLILKNIGTREKPMFDVKTTPVKGYWNAESLPGGNQMEDWNGDGSLDIINGFSVSFGTDRRFPGAFGETINVTKGSPIRHEVPYGDENAGIVLYDFDRDGDRDCVYGAHSGHIWFHENRGSDKAPDWNTAGQRFTAKDNKAIKVGFPEGYVPAVFDFTVLQGARAKPALGDFNGDGVTDLVVADTFGKVRYFENVGTNRQPQFAEPEVIFDRKNRANVTSGNWNSDERPDLIIVLGGKVFLLENEAIKGKTKFKSPKDMNLPESPGNFSSLMMADFNRDGDMDLIYNTSHRMTCWIEGSFQKNGYLEAQVISVEEK